MNVPEAWGHYRTHTTTLSAVVRQLALAGIAVVWIFKTGEDDSPQVPYALRWASMLLFAALAVDLLQYAFLAFRWRLFARSKEIELHGEHGGDVNKSNEAQFGAPPDINMAGELMLAAKVILALIGAGILVAFLFSKVR